MLAYFFVFRFGTLALADDLCRWDITIGHPTVNYLPFNGRFCAILYKSYDLNNYLSAGCVKFHYR